MGVFRFWELFGREVYPVSSRSGVYLQWEGEGELEVDGFPCIQTVLWMCDSYLFCMENWMVPGEMLRASCHKSCLRAFKFIWMWQTLGLCLLREQGSQYDTSSSRKGNWVHGGHWTLPMDRGLFSSFWSVTCKQAGGVFVGSFVCPPKWLFLLCWRAQKGAVRASCSIFV